MRYSQRQSEQVIFRSLFKNSDYERDLGATLVGSPTVSSGLILNGSSQYETVPVNTFQQCLNGKTVLSIEQEFIPTTAANDNVAHYFFDTTAGAGARCYAVKSAANAIDITLGNTALTTIAYASFSAYWKLNASNHLAICATSGSTLVYLNNNLIATIATAWSLTAQPATLYIGATNAGATPFAGTILSLSIYATKWSAEEVNDAYNKQTFSEIAFSKAVVHLPCKSIYANTGDGVMLGTDMDMETAGVANWPAVNSATVTKEAGSPSGTGTQVLRVAYNGIAEPQVYQTLVTIGKLYHITGWMRGDGTVIPHILLSGTTDIVGSASTTWVYYDKLIVAVGGSSRLFLYTNASSAGHWAEFDNITLQEVDFLTENQGTGADVKVGDSGLYGVTQAQYNGFVYDGANSLLSIADPIGTSAGTFGALINPTTFGEGPNTGRIFDNGKFIFRHNAAVLACTSDGSTAVSSAANSVALGVWQAVFVTRTAAGVVNFYINGQLSGTANQASGTPTTATTDLIIGNNSGRTATFNGTIKYPTVNLNYIATLTQIKELTNKMFAMLNKG